MASVQEIVNQINTVLKESKDSPYSNYSCKTVSWDDVQRGTVGGTLSCWGSNITDTRLYAKDGRQLFTVRGDNWNERLGKVTSNDLALIATETNGGGDPSGLHPVTLRSVLLNISKFGRYAKLDNIDSLLDEKLDEEVSVRFQTTFLPVKDGEKQTIEFAPEAYNYNTMDDEDPRNLILLCTTQGLAIQQDGNGAKKLFHHVNDGGKISRYWLEAESSSHKVGGSQVETKEEKEDAVKHGKATSAVIGTKAIGTRFNVLMTIQVPLQQKQRKRMKFSPEYSPWDGGCEDSGGVDGVFYGYGNGDQDYQIGALFGARREQYDQDGNDKFYSGLVPQVKAFPRSVTKFRRLGEKRSSAARVSKGSCYDTWSGLSVVKPKRNKSEHITATIVMYYTCSGGVPSASEVKSAIDDLEQLYQAIEVTGNLSNNEFNFMKSKLSANDMSYIKTKITNQPPPKPCLPINADIFPN